MEFYIAQAIGLVITALSLVMQHFKKMRLIVITEVLMNLMAGVQYFLLGGFSGVYISAVGVASALCMLVYIRFGDPEKHFVPNLLCVIFGVLHVILGAWSFHAWYDVFPILGAVFATVAVVQSKASGYRLLRIGNAASWITYCACTGAYAMILMHSLTICSCVMAILRLDVKRKEKNAI